MNPVKNDWKNTLTRLLTITFAAFIMAVNIKSFVRTGGLFPGGATGLTLLIQRAGALYFHVEVPYTIINVLLNLFPIYIGYRYIGKKFTSYSIVMIMLTNFFTDFIPSWVITYDTLLISIFGGLVNGFVISLCLRANATSGGTDFIAVYFSQKKGIDSFNIVFFINAGILLIAGLMFGWDKSLYSIIFQYTSTQVVHVMYKEYKQNTLLVITDKPQEVADMIYQVCNHGATILDGEGSHEHGKKKIIYSIVSSAESKLVIRKIHEIDKDAFINELKTEQVTGHFYQKPHQ